MTLLRLIFLLFLCILPQATSLADDEKPWVVSTRNTPPFSFQDASGQWKGLSIELWEACAKDLGLEYTYQEQSLADIIRGGGEQPYDIAVAGISLTREREAQLDFTHSFLNSQLAIAYVNEARNPIFAVFHSVFSLNFLLALLPLMSVLLLIGIIIWYLERKTNPEEFSPSPGRGLADGFWFSAVTMTTVGYGDKAPKTTGGKLIALFWMFASVIIISSFTATIASSLTAGYYDNRIESIADLKDKKIATTEKSTSAQFLGNLNMRTLLYDTPDAALDALVKDKVSAVVFDEPTLRYLAQSIDQPLRIVPINAKPQQYGLVLPSGSPMRERINQSLLKVIQTPEWNFIKQKYLGE